MEACETEAKRAPLMAAQLSERFTVLTHASGGAQRLVRAKTAELPDTKAKLEGRRANLSSL